MSQPYQSDGNPFRPAVAPSQRNVYEPGTPWWWLHRLIQKLMDRQERYDTLEDYALGHHPYPNLDYRYVKALQDLQKKARTNYCELIIQSTTERMKVKGFRFGPTGEADQDAKRIWDYNDMDFQCPVALKTAATFGFAYALVTPPDPKDPDAEPGICIEDPRMCIVERDPYKTTRSLAGLKFWQDDTLEQIVAVLYLPDWVVTFVGRTYNPQSFAKDAKLTNDLGLRPDAGGFEMVNVQANPLGEVPLVEGPWQPAFGELGRAEHENVIDIQDRINHTVLDRLIISKSQAYRQRWATGVSQGGKKGQRKPPFDPGADVLWITANPDANFGDFDSADISNILAAIRDDVGDMAAISKTPATYLMNRMVNVSGDTLTQDQSALVMKVRNRQEAMGWFFERVMKVAFKYKKDDRWKTTEASTLWSDPEIRTLAEIADAFNKLVTAGVPLEIAMEKLNFSPDEIKFAVQKQQEMQEQTEEREDEVADRDTENAIKEEKAKPKPKASGSK